MTDAYEAGEGSYATLAARFAVGEATVKRWVWRYRDRGHGRDAVTESVRDSFSVAEADLFPAP